MVNLGLLSVTLDPTPALISRLMFCSTLYSLHRLHLSNYFKLFPRLRRDIHRLDFTWLEIPHLSDRSTPFTLGTLSTVYTSALVRC